MVVAHQVALSFGGSVDILDAVVRETARTSLS